MGEDLILHKLFKTIKSFLKKPLADIVNSCLNASTFPDLDYEISLISADKGGTHKDFNANYRPASVLNTLSK